MAREEKTERVAKMTEAAYRYAPNSEAERQAFMAGVAHADAHPEPNLVDIDKACKIISDKVENYINFYGDDDYSFDKQGFIKQFKEAMKGE